jgi:hypothetical protein
VRRSGAALAALGSLIAFVAALFLRLDAAYGPFNLSLHPSDWTVVWELYRHGQIAPAVVAQGAGLGVAAAAVPWLLFAVALRRRGAR